MLFLARPTVELAEAELAVRDEAADPELLSQRERLPLVVLGRPTAGSFAASGNLPDNTQGPFRSLAA